MGHVKLTDFGCSKVIVLWISKLWTYHSLTLQRYNTRSHNRRQSFVCSMGTLDYTAPEVLYGQSYTHSVDYWSLDCILFEILAEFHPFRGVTAEETRVNLENWTQVLRLHYNKPEDLNLSEYAWDAITKSVHLVC